MPALECPLGARCHDGEDVATWKTQDVDIELALKLQETHMKYAHQATVPRPQQSGGASSDPIHKGPADNLNINKGAQGGNFVKSQLNKPKFYIQSPRGSSLIQHYQKIRLIGVGSFGEVWIVKPKNVHASQEFIMKEIPCTEENVETGRNEINILKNCRDERIVCYIEDFYENSKIQIIMEYCEGGDLAKFIAAQKQFLDVDFIMEWVIQLTSGVCFIHRKKIIHRDLKPANIFLTSDKQLKIGDFGISKGLERTIDLASTFVGTAIYAAPEIHGGNKNNMMADLWSLGVIFFEIITLKKPFHGQDFLQAISKEKL